jgi:hypothetical protein
MRGKTCEVKAAQPKDGSNRGGAAGGGKGFRNDRGDPKHFSGFVHQGPPFPGIPPMDPVSFPQPPPGAMMGAAPMHHYPFFPPGPGYMPPIYTQPASMPYHHPQAQQQQFQLVGYAGAFNPAPPPYPIVGQEPMQDGPSFVPLLHPGHSQPYPPSLPMMHTMAPAAPMSYPQSSVMQPVAPGIPYKDDEGIKDGVNS